MKKITKKIVIIHILILIFNKNQKLKTNKLPNYTLVFFFIKK